MYLQVADSLEDIIVYGMNPVIEFMNILEDEILDDMNPDSREHILWLEMKGKALRVREASIRIYQADMARSRQEQDKMELPLNESEVKP